MIWNMEVALVSGTEVVKAMITDLQVRKNAKKSVWSLQAGMLVSCQRLKALVRAITHIGIMTQTENNVVSSSMVVV